MSNILDTYKTEFGFYVNNTVSDFNDGAALNVSGLFDGAQNAALRQRLDAIAVAELDAALGSFKGSAAILSNSDYVITDQEMQTTLSRLTTEEKKASAITKAKQLYAANALAKKWSTQTTEATPTTAVTAEPNEGFLSMITSAFCFAVTAVIFGGIGVVIGKSWGENTSKQKIAELEKTGGSAGINTQGKTVTRAEYIRSLEAGNRQDVAKINELNGVIQSLKAEKQQLEKQQATQQEVKKADTPALQDPTTVAETAAKLAEVEAQLARIEALLAARPELAAALETARVEMIGQKLSTAMEVKTPTLEAKKAELRALDYDQKMAKLKTKKETQETLGQATQAVDGEIAVLQGKKEALDRQIQALEGEILPLKRAQEQLTDNKKVQGELEIEIRDKKQEIENLPKDAQRKRAVLAKHQEVAQKMVADLEKQVAADQMADVTKMEFPGLTEQQLAEFLRKQPTGTNLPRFDQPIAQGSSAPIPTLLDVPMTLAAKLAKFYQQTIDGNLARLQQRTTDKQAALEKSIVESETTLQRLRTEFVALEATVDTLTATPTPQAAPRVRSHPPQDATHYRVGPEDTMMLSETAGGEALPATIPVAKAKKPSGSGRGNN